MNYSTKEIMQYIEEEDVKFIRLAITDVYGVQKNISLLPGELEKAFEYGIPFDASQIAGFGGDTAGDAFLHPDPSTITVLPWRPEHGKVVRMFCTLSHPDGAPFEADSRAALKKAVAFAKEKGYSFNFKSELQFYLFKTDEDGMATGEPYDNAGFMDIAPLDKGENVRREICLTLEQMGIMPESSHHETGPGQNQIDFKYADALTSADNTVTFLSVVRTIAARNGLYADFSPKPIADKPGSALLTDVSVKTKDGRDVSDKIIAGILGHISEMTAFFNPAENSYQRFGRLKAPKYITWSKSNRTGLLCTPATFDGHTMIQLRSPDPTANPYLVFALIIYAVMDAVENGIETPEAVDTDLYGAPAQVQERYALLPNTHEKAKTAAQNSEFINKALPEEIVRAYVK